MSSTQANGSNPKSWIASALQRRWVRLSLLIGVLIFEFGFIQFITHYGWHDSVDAGTTMGVIFVAVLPLLVAALVLMRKRINLKSAFVAFTLFAVFMGISMRPVYEARQARVPSRALVFAGVDLVEGFRDIDLDADVPVYNEPDSEKESLPDWVVRLMGEYAQLPAANEIYGVNINSKMELGEFMKVADRLPNLGAVSFEANFGGMPKNNFDSRELERHAEFLGSLNANSIHFSGYGEGELDLNWLDANHNFCRLGFYNCPDGPELTRKLKNKSLEMLSFSMAPTGPTTTNWKEFCECSAVQKLKLFFISGCQLTDSDAAEFSRLKNLKSLTMHVWTVRDFSFLNEMPSLRVVDILSNVIDEDGLRNFVVPENLKVLTLYVSEKSVSEAAVERFRNSAPDGCKVTIHRN